MPITDSSSASLDGNPAGGLGDILDAVVKPKAPAPGMPADPASGVTDILQDMETERTGRVAAAARWAKNFDPEAYAKASTLAPGLPPEVGVRQMPALEQAARLNQYEEVFANAPALRSYFVDNPKDLAYTNPDELDKYSGVNWALRAFPAAFGEGMDQVELAQLGWQEMAGTATPEMIQAGNALYGDGSSRTFGNHGDWVSSGLVGVAQTLPQMLAVGAGSLVKGMKYSIAGGLGGFAVGGPAGAAAGMTAGGTVGLGTGALEQNIQLQAGLAYYQFKNFKDETGKPLDPTVAKWAALLAGVGQGGLEQLGLAKTVGKIPGLERVFDSLSVKGMKTALANPTIRTALTNFAKNMGESVTVETLTEMGQQGLQVLAGEMAKAESGQDFQMLTGPEAAQQIGQAGLQALQVMTLLGPLTSGTRFAADLQLMQRSKRSHDNLVKAVTQLSDDPLIKRAPQVASQIIDSQAGAQKLYIPADQMRALYQSDGRDVYGPPLPNWRQRLDGALATGGDVEVSVGEFIAHLASDPKNQPLIDLVRSDPQDYLPAEMKEYSDSLDELLGSEVQKAQTQTLAAEPDSTVKDALKKQITDAGFTPDAANHYATVLGAYFNTRAKQLGITPEEFASTNGLEIQRPEEGTSHTIENGNGMAGDPTDILFQPAWHGSPHEFDQFSLDKIGTGEGAQAFGWGLYFAGDRKLAEFYRNKLTREEAKWTLDGVQVSPEIQDIIDNHAFQNAAKSDIEEAITDSIKNVKQELIDIPDNPWIQEKQDLYLPQLEIALADLKAAKELGVKKKGRLFQVDLPPDEVLAVWDDQFQNQGETVQAALKEALDERGAWEALQAIYGEAGMDEVPVSTLYHSLQETFEEWEPDDGTPALKGDKAASELLRSKGLAGHKFLKGSSRKVGDLINAQLEDFNFVIYDDAHVKVLEYFQEQRGSITFRKDSSALIKLFDKADMSTLLHEAGHFFLQTTRDLASSSPEIDADWQVIRKHFGIGEDGKITRDQHEAFARAAEAYFMEGKAPTAELRSAFQAFRQWLKAIYRSLTKLGGKVHPEIAEVFDRMLAGDARVEAVASDTPYAPLFSSAEELGLSPEDYLAYQNLVEDLKSDAQDSVLGRVVGQQKRLQKGWMGEIQKQLAKEAEAKLRQVAPYKHVEAFKTPGFAINVEEFTKKYGQEAAKAFPRQAFNKSGMDPQVVAELLSYPTADEMVYDFTQAEPLKDAAKSEASAEMVRRYGDNFEQQEVLDLAVKRALAEEGRLTILGTEYKALSQKAGRSVSDKGPRQMAQEIARRSLYLRKVKDVNERQSQAAARRAATMAEAATRKGKWAEAADWKRKQLLAQAIDNETQKLNRTIQKIRDKAARYTRSAPAGIDPATMEQIRALVTDYEFAKVPLRKLARRQALREWMDQAEAEGLVTKIPDYLLRDAAKTNYKELSVEQLLGFGDALDNLEHLGRLKSKLRTSKGQREFAATKNIIIESLNKRERKARKMETYTKEKLGLRDAATSFTATWLKPEQIVEWLDSGDIAGPMMEYIFQPIADAQYAQSELNKQYNSKIVKIFEGIDSKYLNEIVHIPGLKTSMTRQEIYAVALNTGNDSNRAKLMEGELWTDGQLAEVLSHMGKEDWDRVQNIWNVLDTLWGKIAALEKRLTGVAPPRVEGREFTNQHGTYAGGYYPVVYDFEARRGLNLLEDTTPGDRNPIEGLFDSRFIKPGTNHTHTYARTKVAKPVKLELAILPGHIHNVVHDLTYREPVRAAYRILSDPDIRRAISEVESKAVYEQLTHWLQSVATEHAFESDPNIRLLQRVRTGATMFGMGFRLTTAIAQPLGFFTSLTRVGSANLLPAIYQMTRHPLQTLEMVNGLSGEIRDRFNQQDRDIRDTVKKVSLKDSPLDKVRNFAFFFIGAADKYVATATWLGAYKQALQSNPADEALAIRTADRTVRLTQGTGTVKDMAKVTNNGEVLKLFTMFYSFFSAQYNMQVDLTRKTKHDISEGDWNTLMTERLPQWAYLVAFPAVFGALLTGQGPQDDEDYATWAAKTVAMYPLASMPFIREISSAVGSGFSYTFTPAGKAFEQTAKALSKLSKGDVTGAIKPAITAVGTGFKLPIGQAMNSVDALWKGLEKGDFEAQDLIFGRRGKDK